MLLYHQPRVLLPAFGLLLGALVAVIWLDNAVNRGVTYAPVPPPIPWADVPQGGVNVFNLHLEPDPAVVSRTLELAQGLGVHYVRMQVPWEDIEIAGPGDFVDRRHDLDGDGVADAVSAWAKYDRIVAKARALGLELIFRLERPPAWARQQGMATAAWQAGLARNSDSTGPPDDFSAFARFAGAVAARYRGQVRFYQIWNEPNLVYEWGWQQPDPVRFVDLLRVGSEAIRAADPAAVVIFPSLAPTDGLDPLAPISDLDFLDQVYQNGGAPYFDIVSAQAYGLGQPPEEHRYVRLRQRTEWNWLRPLDTRTDVSRIVLLREVMERHGDHQKAIWIGEFGWNTAPEHYPQTWGPPVSPAQQAAYIVGQMQRARREWPWVGVMNIWMLRWGGPDPLPGNPTPYFAIVGRDWQPLPAYDAVRAYLAQPVAGVGAHAWTHPAVERRAAATWAVRFEGTSFALLGGAGRCEVTIDGGPPLSCAAGGADRVATVAGDLPNGAHTALVRSPTGPPQAFLVGRAPPLPLWLWALMPALLTIGLVIIGGLAARTLIAH